MTILPWPLRDNSAPPQCPRCTNSLRRLPQASDAARARYYRCDECEQGFIFTAAGDTPDPPTGQASPDDLGRG